MMLYLEAEAFATKQMGEGVGHKHIATCCSKGKKHEKASEIRYSALKYIPYVPDTQKCQLRGDRTGV